MSCDDWAELNRARLLLEVEIEIEEDDEVT